VPLQPFLLGLVEQQEILFRSRAKFDPTRFRVALINDTDLMTQSEIALQVFKRELLASDGYARQTWAPSGAPIIDAINNTVDYAVVSPVFTKPASPVTPTSHDCVIIIADGHAIANRTVATCTSAAFQFAGVAHGLAVGDRVFFTGASGFPTNIVADTFYFVVAANFTSTQFSVSATAGGVAIANGASFTGILTVRYANGVPLYFEKIPNDGAGNNTRILQPGEPLAIAIAPGAS